MKFENRSCSLLSQTKKWLLVISLALALIPNRVKAVEDWRITDFNSSIVVLADGTVDVTEEINADFGGLQKHGIFRDIPVVYQNKDGSQIEISFSVVRVLNGNNTTPYSVSRKNSYNEIKIGDANKTISGKQNYLIEYTVAGVIKPFDKYDEFYWNVTGNYWPVPINNSSATVTLPSDGIIQTACYVGSSGSSSNCQKATPTQKEATFLNQSTLNANEGLTIAVGYTKGMVPIIPASTVGFGGSQINIVSMAIIYLITLIFGLGIILLIFFKLHRRHGKDTTAELLDSAGKALSTETKKAIIAEYDPPYGLRPGELGVIVDERADTLDVTATIVDLAIRGYLTIAEVAKKWKWGDTDYILKRTMKEPTKLLDYEKNLLSKLFKDGQEVKISDLKYTFHQDLAQIKDDLYQDVTDKKFFLDNPNKLRSYFFVLAVFILVAGIIFTVVLSTTSSIGIGIALITCAVVTFILAFKLPQRSILGQDAYHDALGYKLFVSGTEKYRQPFLEKENIFTQVLPYAIVFGVTDKLANAMKEMGIKPPAPSWYVGSTPFYAATFVTNLNSFSNSLSSVMASAPSGSGSGGGGFSGGGFGGGGGGSW